MQVAADYWLARGKPVPSKDREKVTVSLEQDLSCVVPFNKTHKTVFAATLRPLMACLAVGLSHCLLLQRAFETHAWLLHRCSSCVGILIRRGN